LNCNGRIQYVVIFELPGTHAHDSFGPALFEMYLFGQVWYEKRLILTHSMDMAGDSLHGALERESV